MITTLLPSLAAYAVTGRGRTRPASRLGRRSTSSSDLVFFGGTGFGKTVPIKALGVQQVDSGRAGGAGPHDEYTPLLFMLGGRHLRHDRTGRRIDPLGVL